MKFATALRELRHDLKLSSTDFAEKLGISPSRLSQWENGKYLPDLQMIERICNIFNVDPDIFFNVSVERASALEDIHYEAKGLSPEDAELILTMIRRLRR